MRKIALITLLLLLQSCTVQKYYITKERVDIPDPVFNSAVLLLSKKGLASGAVVKVKDKNSAYVITVRHFCDGIKEKFRAVAAPHSAGKLLYFSADVFAVHQDLDLCIIKITGDSQKIKPRKNPNFRHSLFIH